MEPQPERIDRTEQPTALVYVTRLDGNGYVAGFGYAKAFAFSVPEALRRLASELEKTPAAFMSQPGDASIETLGISVRVWNCLRWAEPPIKTIGELAACGPITLLGIRNFGERSLREVIKVLNDADVPLREPTDEELRFAPYRLIWERAKGEKP